MQAELFVLLVTAPLLTHGLSCWTEIQANLNTSNGLKAEGSIAGFQTCSSKETRCGKVVLGCAMTLYSQMDGAKDNSWVSSWLNGKRGNITKGSMCMSARDCTDIIAFTHQDGSSCKDSLWNCCCTGDQCTGGAAGALRLVGAILALIVVLL